MTARVYLRIWYIGHRSNAVEFPPNRQLAKGFPSPSFESFGAECSRRVIPRSLDIRTPASARLSSTLDSRHLGCLWLTFEPGGLNSARSRRMWWTVVDLVVIRPLVLYYKYLVLSISATYIFCAILPSRKDFSRRLFTRRKYRDSRSL